MGPTSRHEDKPHGQQFFPQTLFQLGWLKYEAPESQTLPQTEVLDHLYTQQTSPCRPLAIIYLSCFLNTFQSSHILPRQGEQK